MLLFLFVLVVCFVVGMMAVIFVSGLLLSVFGLVCPSACFCLSLVWSVRLLASVCLWFVLSVCLSVHRHKACVPVSLSCWGLSSLSVGPPVPALLSVSPVPFSVSLQWSNLRHTSNARCFPPFSNRATAYIRLLGVCRALTYLLVN